MWPLGQQGINHSKSDVSLLLGSLHTTLCWWGVQQWREWWWHRLGLGWLRHLSFIVVSCISWHLAVVIDCKSQPPLKIISHKILRRVGRDGGTAVSETSAWCATHLYCLVRRTLMLAWLHILPTIHYMQLCTREANIGLSDGHLSHQASAGCSTFMLGWKYWLVQRPSWVMTLDFLPFRNGSYVWHVCEKDHTIYWKGQVFALGGEVIRL